jgi:hypothetical protein
MTECARLGKGKCSEWVRPYFVSLDGRRFERNLCDRCVVVARGLGAETTPTNYQNIKGIAWLRQTPSGKSHAAHGTLEKHAPQLLCGLPSDGFTHHGSRRVGPVCRICKDRYARKPPRAPVVASLQ